MRCYCSRVARTRNNDCMRDVAPEARLCFRTRASVVFESADYDKMLELRLHPIPTILLHERLACNHSLFCRASTVAKKPPCDVSVVRRPAMFRLRPGAANTVARKAQKARASTPVLLLCVHRVVCFHRTHACKDWFGLAYSVERAPSNQVVPRKRTNPSCPNMASSLVEKSMSCGSHSGSR